MTLLSMHWNQQAKISQVHAVKTKYVFSYHYTCALMICSADNYS